MCVPIFRSQRLAGLPPMDIKTFQLFIGEATVTFGDIQSLSFALKRAVNKVLYCIGKVKHGKTDP